jgi:D-tyrosyl-tRNA(Tyr) deacylase
MVIVLQRVKSAEVKVAEQIVGAIEKGYLLLVGIAGTDTENEIKRLAQEVAKVRLMPDAEGKFGINLPTSGGAVLAVSQFTLLASFAKGNRPSFHEAAAPAKAEPLFDLFVQELTQLLGRPIATGQFGADMEVKLINDGPVTVILE